jgi:ABC-type amino acid transport substrate-binding protein
VLNEIRRLMSRDLDLHLEGPSKVSLFLYDNHTVIVENFNDTPVDVKLAGASLQSLTDLESGASLAASADSPAGGFFYGRMTPPEPKAALTVPAHSYRAFHYDTK